MNQPSTQRWRRILSGSARGPLNSALRLGLAGASLGYRAAAKCRHLLYDLGLLKSHRLDRPVLSVGNLTAGGTGKTPMVMELVGRLEALSCRPAVLLRGYKGEELKLRVEPGTPPPPRRRSDEQMLYEQAFGGRTPVAADPDRVRSAKWLLHEHPEIDIFVMDDAFQHRRVRRQFDLVLVDATCPFGYGHLLPRGLLRESMDGLRRADGIIVTRSDEVSGDELKRIRARIATIAGPVPQVMAAHEWAGLLDERDQPCPMDMLAKIEPWGICGIANPDSFAHTLRRHSGRDHVRMLALGDHHRYRAGELLNWMSEARKAGHSIVTTEKDWVKWKPLLAGLESKPPIYRPRMKIRFLENESQVTRWLSQMAEMARGQSESDVTPLKFEGSSAGVGGRSSPDQAMAEIA